MSGDSNKRCFSTLLLMLSVGNEEVCWGFAHQIKEKKRMQTANDYCC
jgi:hypothetical protein